MDTQKRTTSLPQTHLEACYREANAEVDENFDILSSEGVEDEETR